MLQLRMYTAIWENYESNPRDTRLPISIPQCSDSGESFHFREFIKLSGPPGDGAVAVCLTDGRTTLSLKGNRKSRPQ